MAYLQHLEMLENNSIGYRSPDSFIQEGITEAKMAVVTENAGQIPAAPGKSASVKGNWLWGSVGLTIFVILMVFAGICLLPER